MRAWLPALTLLASLGASSEAWAAACCGEASTGDRLNFGEDLMIAVRPSGRVRFGSFDREGAFHASGDATDVTGELDVATVVRVAPRLELGASLPLVLNYRAVKGLDDEVGGGGGDVAAWVTWTPISPWDVRWVPSVALALKARIPTGVAPGASDEVLASDVTGDGRAELAASASLDKTYLEHLRVASSLGFSLFAVPGSEAGDPRRASRLAWSAGVGLIWAPVAILAGAAGSYDFAPSERRLLDLTLSSSVDLRRDLELLLSVRSPLPVDGFMQDDLAMVRFGTGLRATWSL